MKTDAGITFFSITYVKIAHYFESRFSREQLVLLCKKKKLEKVMTNGQLNIN